MSNKDLSLQEAALILLESGEYPEGCKYCKKELMIEMQKLIDNDPWLDEPWTEEEKKIIEDA